MTPLSKQEADWLLVPRVPTEEMVAAGGVQQASGRDGPDSIYRAMISAYLSTQVDGLEVVKKLNEGVVVEQSLTGDGAHIDIPATETLLSQASALISSLQQANEALMQERTSLIETKREQIEKLTKERIAAERDALDAYRKLTAAEARLKQAEGVIRQAERRFNSIRGAIESNQVVDKDAHGTAIAGRDAARQFLENSNGQ